MKKKKFQEKYFLMALFGIITFLILFVASGTMANLALPPRDDATPDTTVVDIAQGTMPIGTRLQLNAQFSDAWPWDTMQWQDVWSEVQWQDDKGEWFEVDGWKGNLDTIAQSENGWVGTKEWWASDDIIGSGPYRWNVYTHPGGDLLTTSEPFNLATYAGGMVVVPVELAP